MVSMQKNGSRRTSAGPKSTEKHTTPSTWEGVLTAEWTGVPKNDDWYPGSKRVSERTAWYPRTRKLHEHPVNKQPRSSPIGGIGGVEKGKIETRSRTRQLECCVGLTRANSTEPPKRA